MKNIDYFKFGATKLEDVSVLHIEGEFESVIELLQGQVTSDCSMLSDSFGQVSALCDEKGEECAEILQGQHGNFFRIASWCYLVIEAIIVCSLSAGISSGDVTKETTCFE